MNIEENHVEIKNFAFFAKKAMLLWTLCHMMAAVLAPKMDIFFIVISFTEIVWLVIITIITWIIAMENMRNKIHIPFNMLDEKKVILYRVITNIITLDKLRKIMSFNEWALDRNERGTKMFHGKNWCWLQIAGVIIPTIATILLTLNFFTFDIMVFALFLLVFLKKPAEGIVKEQ